MIKYKETPIKSEADKEYRKENSAEEKGNTFGFNVSILFLQS